MDDGRADFRPGKPKPAHWHVMVMTTEHRSQPRYLTLTELVLNLGLFVGGGYWAFGLKGACAGAALLSARYIYLIWLAIQVKKPTAPVKRTSGEAPDRSPD